MTVQPFPADASPAMSARSLIHGQGHPSQVSRMRQRWRLETSGQVFLVRRAAPADLPSVMGTMVRSSALSRWQWRRTRGGGVPSMSEVAQWLRQPASLVVVSPSPTGSRVRGPRIVAIAGLDSVTCAGGPADHVAQGEVLVADPWQGLGIGGALVGHLGAAAWLLGRRELVASPLADAETSERLLASFGPVHHSLHPHGSHARVRLNSDAVTGLGPFRVARLG
jgi:GNAT superfamily N-acetyltransferase